MQQALEHFDHAIRLDPRLAEAYRGRAAARGWDDADKTIADYEEALRLNPDDEALKGSLIEMYVNHASFFLENGECGKAVELYSKAMSLDPPDGGFGYEVFVWRGDAFFKQGEVAKAAADYSVALQMGEHEKDDNPETYSDILSKRASCYLKLEQYAKAKRDMEESQKLDPEFSEDETADQREPDGPRCRQCGEEIDADEEVTHLDCCRGPYHEECLRSFMCRSCGQCRRCCDRTACGREPFAEPECHKCGEPITRDEDISKCYYCRRPVHEKCVEWCPACHKCLDCCRSKGCALKAEG
jgi:Tfp pilus assembly protein PilF